MCSRIQYTDLTYTGGTGPFGPMRVIFCSIIQSWNISLNIKFGVNPRFHVPKTLVYRFDLYGRYRILRTDKYIFWLYYLKLVYKSKHKSNPTFHVLKIPVYRFHLYGRYRTLQTDSIIFDSVIQNCYISLNVQFGMNQLFHVLKIPVYRFDLHGRYLVPCEPMSTIFCSVIQSWYISLNLKFGANRTFHVPKTPEHRFDYYGRYRNLWTNENNLW